MAGRPSKSEKESEQKREQRGEAKSHASPIAAAAMAGSGEPLFAQAPSPKPDTMTAGGGGSPQPVAGGESLRAEDLAFQPAKADDVPVSNPVATAVQDPGPASIEKEDWISRAWKMEEDHAASEAAAAAAPAPPKSYTPPAAPPSHRAIQVPPPAPVPQHPNPAKPPAYDSCSNIVGNLLDVTARILRDEVLSRNLAYLVEELAEQARVKMRIAAGEPGDPETARLQKQLATHEKESNEAIVKLMDRSVGVFSGRAEIRKADGGIGYSSLHVLFHPRGVLQGVQGMRVSLMQGNSLIDTRNLQPGQVEVDFNGLAKGTYEVQVGLPPELQLGETQVIDPNGKPQAVQGNQVDVDGCHDKQLVINLCFVTRPVEIVVFEDKDGSGKYSGQRRVDNVPVRLLHGHQLLTCGTSSKGCCPLQVPGPGLYCLEAPPTIRISGCTYHLTNPGPIAFMSQPGETCKLIVPVGYTRHGASLTVAPQFQGVETAPVDFALLRDGDSAFLQTGTSSNGSSIVWSALEEDMYTLLVKPSPGFELLTPRSGMHRVKVVSGQPADVGGLIRLRPAPANSHLNEISGRISDDNGPVAYRKIDLITGPGQQIVASSFTAPSGDYYFATVHDARNLLLRIGDQTASVVDQPSSPARKPLAEMPALLKSVNVG